jgi:hypothetical protein
MPRRRNGTRLPLDVLGELGMMRPPFAMGMA